MPLVKELLPQPDGLCLASRQRTIGKLRMISGEPRMNAEAKHSDWQSYETLPGLEEVYLEDSFVLDIQRSEDGITFLIEFVVTEQHPKYAPTDAGEQYCYRRGKLTFSEIESIYALDVSNKPFIDAQFEQDMGNVDVFRWKGDRFFLTGDWGKLDLISKRLVTSFLEH